MSDLAAVILTGVREQHHTLLTHTEIKNKTLLPVYHKPMLQWVYDALSQTSLKPDIFISTDDPDIKTYCFENTVGYISSGNSAVSSFLQSILQVPKRYEWILIVSGDHALLTPTMVEYFIRKAQSQQAGLAVAVVKKSTVNQRYPNSIRTYLTLKDDAYSGGNLYLVHKPSFMVNVHVLEEIDKNRKAPWKSLIMLDWWTIIRIAFKQIDIQTLGEKVSKMIGCKTVCITLPYAEACMDLDKPSDVILAEAILRARAFDLPLQKQLLRYYQ